MYKLYRISLLLLVSLWFSSCLTRKNAIPPSSKPSPKNTEESSRTGTVSRSAPQAILTDASDGVKGIASTTAELSSLLQAYAQAMQTEPTALKTPQLYLMIHEWMGVSHRLGGQSKSGIDCSAFVNMTLQEVYGKELPRTAAEMADQVKRKYENQLKEGDLVFFSFGNRNIDHVGIYLTNGKFVHVSTSRGVIISRLKDSWYYKHFKRAGSI